MSQSNNVMAMFRVAIEDYEQALMEAREAEKIVIKAQKEAMEAAKAVDALKAKLDTLILNEIYTHPMLDG